MIDYAALEIEIETDPADLGYAEHVAAGSDNVIAKLLSIVGVWDVSRTVIDISALLKAMNYDDWKALTDVDRQFFQMYSNIGRVDLSDQNVRDTLTAIFPEGTATHTALFATVKGSRAEFLFGPGVVVSAEDVATALRKDK